jgi:uroporphyrinogen-III synthase
MLNNEAQKGNLKQARIALLEARMSEEMADLIRRYNGQPYNVPAVREVPLESRKEVAAFIEQLTRQHIDIVVFFTGVGVTALFREAEALDRVEELRSGLQKTTIVCRGPKPSAIVRKQKLPIHVSAVEPYTTKELLAALQTLDVTGKTVAVLHYGERNTQVTQELRARGAHIEELCLYEWLLPEDTTLLKELVTALQNKQIAAIVFTSQVHVRHLFQIATEMQQRSELQYALNQNTIVASVGPTCTAGLQEYGVKPHVIPEHPKMGHLVKALAEYMSAS